MTDVTKPKNTMVIQLIKLGVIVLLCLAAYVSVGLATEEMSGALLEGMGLLLLALPLCINWLITIGTSLLYLYTGEVFSVALVLVIIIDASHLLLLGEYFSDYAVSLCLILAVHLALIIIKIIKKNVDISNVS